MSTNSGYDVDSAPSSLPSSTPGSEPGSPRNRVKFLCSHGGKILPRPADRHLKYVGGETRVISVPRDITCSELMKKLTSLIEGEMILKYQLIPEDLDALVTVKSDEDLRHMFEEYDRHELLGAPRLRTFLFPANPVVIEHQIGPMDRQSLEQRYINSINGIVVNSPPVYTAFRPSPISTSYTSFSISSACSSPTTPPETTPSTATAATIASDGVNPEISKFSSMTRVRSSPSLRNLCGNSQNTSKIPSPTPSLSLSIQQHPYHHQNYRQPHHIAHPHTAQRPPLDPNPPKGSAPEHLIRMRSTGLADYYRYQMEHHHHQQPSHYVRPARGGHMFYNRSGLPCDDYFGSGRYERTESPPGSPVMARSPLNSTFTSRA